VVKSAADPAFRCHAFGSDAARIHVLFKDLSFSAVVAGFVAVLVGFTSSAVIVFQSSHAGRGTG
jgi:predicted benzoate:H+ symporter BenE